MGDDAVHREGGEALMKTVSHAVRPTLLRCIGIGCVAAAVAIVKIILSPF